MAFNSIKQPDNHADSTASSTDTPYSVVNFNHLVNIANPYQARQGINAQYSGLTADAEGYAMWLQQQDLFKVCF